jgi:hypothetical protein
MGCSPGRERGGGNRLVALIFACNGPEMQDVLVGSLAWISPMISASSSRN